MSKAKSLGEMGGVNSRKRTASSDKLKWKTHGENRKENIIS